MLRRYRNGIFHYQQEFFDTRIKEGIQAGEQFREWVDGLMQHFQRYLNDWSHKQGQILRLMKSQSQTVN
jgi:hypothetical protein